MNLPIPTEIIPRTRKLMAVRPMGAPTVGAPVVYTSDADKINIEFDAQSISNNSYYVTYLKVYYGNEDGPSVSTLVDDRVLTLRYDFGKKIILDYGYARVGEFISEMEAKGLELGKDYEIEDVLEKDEYLHSETINPISSVEEDEGIDENDNDEKKDTNVFKPIQLARHVMTYGNAYYYITNSGVIRGYGTNASEDAGGEDESAELIPGSFVNIYNNKGLLKDGGIVDLTNGGTSYSEEDSLTLLDYTLPI